MKGKIAAGSLFTSDDQKRLYEEAMGAEALERQVRLADIEARRCTCVPSKLRRRWGGSDRLTTRTVHDPGCARWKPWMAEHSTQGATHV